MSSGNKPKSHKNRTLVLAIILVVLLLIAAIAGAVISLFYHYYNLTAYESVPETVAELPSEVAETVETVEAEVENDILAQIAEAQSQAQAIAESASASAAEETQATEAGVSTIAGSTIYNLLLIGVDRRDTSWNGNSDAMVLVTINTAKQTVTLTSFMRDLGVTVDGYGLKKLNFAYAVGGGSMLVSTIESNFGITINNYAWVDFTDITDIINIMGGVDMELTDEQAVYIGLTPTENHMYHIDGYLALAHVRDRFSGGNDYNRTQKQRNVLLAMANKARTLSVTELMGLAEELLPHFHHNLEQDTLLELITEAPSIINYTFTEQRIPYDGLYYSQNEFLIPDYAQTNQALWASLYN